MTDFKQTFKQLAEKAPSISEEAQSANDFNGRCPDCLGKITDEWMGCPHPGASINWEKEGKVPELLCYKEWKKSTTDGIVVCSYKEVLHGSMSTAGMLGRKRKVDPKQMKITDAIEK